MEGGIIAGTTDCLDMDGLRAFVAIVDTMSFSHAGKAIGRSQSAVSLRLRRLEEDLGVQLLIRRQGRITDLTPPGHKLLAYARQIIQLNDAALRELSTRVMTGRVRLGLPADFFDLGFDAALSSMRPQLGNVAVEIETDVSDHLRTRCLKGEIDLALFKQSPDEKGGQVLAHLALDWIAAADFCRADGPLPLVCFPEGCAYRRTMLEALRHAGIAHQVVFSTPNLDSLRRAITAGIGITALPHALLRDDTRLTIHAGLPALPPVALVLMTAPGNDSIVRQVADGVIAGLRPLLG